MAVGGGIWSEPKMAEVARAGVTHIVDMQIEFDDTPLAEPHGIQVLWNPVDDDFKPKPYAVFQKGVEFALKALEDDTAKLFIHCAANKRVTAFLGLYRAIKLNWGIEKAFALMRDVWEPDPVWSVFIADMLKKHYQR